MKRSYISNIQNLENINLLDEDSLEMTEQRIRGRDIAVLGLLLLLSLGTYTMVDATLENTPMELLEFSTFLGGSGDECMETIAYAFGSTTVDSKGNIIVVGRTTSTDFPLKNAFQDQLNGYTDSTISKFYPNGSLMFSTYFGGSQQELITGVAVDSDDNILIAGITGSSDFPLMNAFQSNSTNVSGGTTDCFITKFSEDGQSLLFSTYFGGTGNDWLYTMTVDSSDRIVISGTTQSTDFPLLHPVQDVNAGSLDIFVSLFEVDGQALLFSTYLGTTGIDHGRGIDFDSQGDIVLTGIVSSGNLTTEGAYQEEYAGGSSDAFLAKFHVNGTLAYFTFFGGASLEWGNALIVDSEDNVIITGFTTSDDLPTLNPYQDERVEYADMFITKFTPDGQSIVFSTYLGGSSVDHGNAITVDSHDNIIVTGQTNSVDFPTTLLYNTTSDYYSNVTLVAFDPDGSLLFSMAFGRLDNDIGIEVVWHSDYSFVILGYTRSTDFPVYEAYQGSNGGDYDMFIMKLNLENLMTTSPTSTSADGFPIGVLEGGIVLGIIAAVALALFVRKKLG